MPVSKPKRTVSKPDKVMVDCPHCGHSQAEPRGAFSTICKKCRGHIRIQAVSRPSRKAAAATAVARRHIDWFDCGTELDESLTAQSTMEQRRSCSIDLQFTHIA